MDGEIKMDVLLDKEKGLFHIQRPGLYQAYVSVRMVDGRYLTETKLVRVKEEIYLTPHVEVRTNSGGVLKGEASDVTFTPITFDTEELK